MTDLKPDQLVSRPVVYIDSEADKVLKIAQDDWVRLSERYDRARKDSSRAQRDQRLGHPGEQDSDRIWPEVSLMTEDSILIRAERLIKGDIVLWANGPWRVGQIEPVSLTEFEIVLEYVQGDHSDLRTVVSQDRKFRALRLV